MGAQLLEVYLSNCVCVVKMLAMLTVNVTEMLYQHADGCSTNVFSRNWNPTHLGDDIMYETLLKNF